MIDSRDIETIKAIRRVVRRAWCECATEQRPYSPLFQPTLKALLHT